MPTEMIRYGFTKAADLANMRGFAEALSASGVTVNAVLPGPTHTEGVAAMVASMGKSANDPKAQRDFIDGGVSCPLRDGGSARADLTKHAAATFR